MRKVIEFAQSSGLNEVKWIDDLTFLATRRKGALSMTTECTALLANPHPCAHIMYPYVDENHVEQAVSLFAGPSIRNGEGVFLIMTTDHCEPITLRLQREGFNVAECERSGQLTCIGAAEFLS